MPKSKHRPQPAARPAAAVNGLVSEVLTLAEAAAYLRISEADVIELVHSQELPGRFVGGEWRFLRSAIQQWLSCGSLNAEARKEAQLALSGKYKDDPDLMRICEEAYRQRGRPTSESD